MYEISPFRSLMNYYPLERIATSHLLTRGIATCWRRLSLLLHYPGILSPPREDYHLSCITLGDYLPLEGIIGSHTLPREDLSTPKEDYYQSCITLGNYQKARSTPFRVLQELSTLP